MSWTESQFSTWYLETVGLLGEGLRGPCDVRLKNLIGKIERLACNSYLQWPTRAAVIDIGLSIVQRIGFAEKLPAELVEPVEAITRQLHEILSVSSIPEFVARVEGLVAGMSKSEADCADPE